METNAHKIYFHYLKAYIELKKANKIDKNVPRTTMIETLEEWMSGMEKQDAEFEPMRHLFCEISGIECQ